MILYTCTDSRGLRASWAAAELGLPLEYRMLPFPPRALAREYLDDNPLGTVPMLVDGETRMTESSAIAHYLVSKVQGSPLAVTHREADYGAYLDFLHHADATLTFPQTVFMRFSLFEKDRGLGEAGLAYADWFEKRLVKIEQRLEGRAFLCEDRMTMADVAVGYALFLSTRIGLSDRLTPNAAAYLSRLTGRPAFKAARAAERAAAEAQGLARSPALR